MLKNISKLAKDIISKNLINSKVFLEIILEFPLYNQIVGLKAMFLLMLLLNHYFIKKQGSKKDLI